MSDGMNDGLMFPTQSFPARHETERAAMLKKIADLTDKLARLQNANGLLVEACEKVMADSIADCAVGLLVTAQTLVGVSDALDAAKEAGR